jgi:Acetyltransferases, including N-acetylases of ribosomal proteins
MGENAIIRTERLILRPLALSDLETAHIYAGDVNDTKYMVYLPNETMQETERFLQRVVSEWEKDIPAFFEFAVVFEEKHIGAVSISLDASGEEGELGWIINKKYQGNGYATEAAKAVMNFAVNKLGVKKIVAHCDYRNISSCRVMQKIGLLMESDSGTRRYGDRDEDVPEYKYSLVIERQEM